MRKEYLRPDSLAHKIYEYVKDHKKICVHEAMDITGRTMATVSSILSDMFKRGILVEAFNRETCRVSDIRHNLYVLGNTQIGIGRRKKGKYTKKNIEYWTKISAKKPAVKSKFKPVKKEGGIDKPKRIIIIEYE